MGKFHNLAQKVFMKQAPGVEIDNFFQYKGRVWNLNP